MNLEKTEKSAASQVAKSDSAVSQKGRRRLVQAGLAGAPLLMALKSTPVLASNCKLPSGFSVSGNLSRPRDYVCTEFINQGVSFWKSKLTNDSTLDINYATAFGSDPKGFGTLLGALNGSDVVYAKAAAVYLNANATERAALKAVVYDGLEGAGYVPSVGAKPWHALEVEAYFNYLLGI
ncbi:MAG: hypothetical protein KA945_04340 [Zoogloea sp.]|nr:hypothetical protein [Zoogloea sp.]